MSTGEAMGGQPSLAVIDLLLRQHEEGLKNLRHWRGNAETKFKAYELKAEAMHDDVVEIRKALDSVKRLLIWLLTSITVSSVGLALSILASTGKLS